MKAVVATLRLNSLYSVRVPFTWQSSQTYPVLPPSSVIGLLANALQRYKNDRDPTYYLGLIDDNVVWAGSRLLSPATVRSYMTSAIVKWGPLDFPYKFTNALGREFAFAQKFEIASVFENSLLAEELLTALRHTPLYLGDSESAATVEEVRIEEADYSSQSEAETFYPVPLKESNRLISGSGKVVLMHERCGRGGVPLPLHAYLVPVEERRKVYRPTSLRVLVDEDRIINIGGVGAVIKREGQITVTSTRRRRR